MTNIISRGGAGVGKSAQMPAWGGTLKPAEIKALVSLPGRQVAAHLREWLHACRPPVVRTIETRGRSLCD